MTRRELITMSSIIKQTVRPLVHAVLGMVSKHRLAGATIDDAMETCAYLQERGYLLTLGYWNIGSEKPAEIVAAYQEAIGQIREKQIEASISIKAWSFNHDRVLYQRMLDHGRRLSVPIHFDSHLVDSADIIFSMIKEDTPLPRADIGCTLPGRWKRSVGDTRLVDELGVNVRIVKGQAADPGDPDVDAEQGFLDVVRELAGRALRVEVATHNYQLARKSLEILNASNTPCELQLLYGLPVKHMFSLVRELNVPVCIYVPYGSGWLMYALSSMLKNPKVIFSLFRDLLGDDYRKQFPVL
jgi:proline dehydrogenase